MIPVKFAHKPAFYFPFGPDKYQTWPYHSKLPVEVATSTLHYCSLLSLVELNCVNAHKILYQHIYLYIYVLTTMYDRHDNVATQ